MRLIKKLSLALLLLTSFSIWSQDEKRFKIHTIAFYNLENLFDTVNDPDTEDEKSPIMEISGDRETIYRKKVKGMARVIADIGYDTTGNSPAIIGVCEIENRKVLEDLISDPLLMPKNYGIIHIEGPDERSIDVALLYQKDLFEPINSNAHELLIYRRSSGKRDFTRDQLIVSGKLDGELIHVMVNHWPSRGGGTGTIEFRNAAAKLGKKIIDSVQAEHKDAKIFTMGDLNDNPTNESVKDFLKAEAKRKKVKPNGIYNPYENMYKKKGLGTTAWRDSWSLFDQIMITQPLLEKDYTSFRYYKAGIYNKDYVTTKRGRWKGYPFRSFADGGYTGGFSDHFPVYVYVIKQVEDGDIVKTDG
ncbi:MAG: endonuclease/exonuclease/phosphatase family protein [Bacteroidota bacterium]